MAEIPTPEEIAELPRWAMVAFAARCAERVLPLVSPLGSAMLGPVQRAVETTRHAASAGRLLPHEDHTIADSDYLSAADGPAAEAARDALESAQFASRAGSRRTALCTHAAAHGAANAVSNFAAPEMARQAFEAAKVAIRCDFNLLLQTAQREHWTDDTPVAPKFFGPMWPDGEPEGWPKPDGDDDAESCLVVYMDPGNASPELIAEYYATLSKLHVALGGTPLEVVREERGTIVPEEV